MFQSKSKSSEKLCPVCGGVALLKVRTQDVNRRISEDIFAYYACRCCGLVFIGEIPSDLADYYTDVYYQIPRSIKELDELSVIDRYKVALIQRFMKQGKLLEIGPAYGMFAHQAKQAGFDVEAIEMDERCCRFLREVVGICAIQSDDPFSVLPSMGPYDIAVFWQVVEHLTEPFRDLWAVVERLSPGGFLVIATPNPHALQFGLFGRFWTHIDAPRHLLLIPMSLLIQQGRSMGLEPVFATTLDVGSLGWNSFGWQMSLSNLVGRPSFKAVLRFIGRVLSFMLRPVERREGCGSAYTIVFKKVS